MLKLETLIMVGCSNKSLYEYGTTLQVETRAYRGHQKAVATALADKEKSP